jgi:hypothetical protein
LRSCAGMARTLGGALLGQPTEARSETAQRRARIDARPPIIQSSPAVNLEIRAVKVPGSMLSRTTAQGCRGKEEMAKIQFPTTLFSGTFDASVMDNNGAPAEVLEAGAPIRVRTQWNINALAALLLGGQWEVTVYAESIGPGPERQIVTTTIPLTGGLRYGAIVSVPPRTLPDDPAPPISGVYKVVTVLTHRNFGKTSDVAAIVEGPMVRIG